jgi:bifunctional non-homologous end joining protein LigD
VLTGSDWIHEIKYDGYRMLVIRDRDRVRLISRGGYDWAERFPLIVSAALNLPERHFVLDGEVVVLRADGVSDFDSLHSRKGAAAPRSTASSSPSTSGVISATRYSVSPATWV